VRGKPQRAMSLETEQERAPNSVEPAFHGSLTTDT
jgi:hypothetical protein